MPQKDQSIQQVITLAEGVAGVTDIEGDAVDMTDGESVEHVIIFGAITAAAVTSIKLQQGDVLSGDDITDASDLLGTAITIADDDDGKIFRLEVIKPLKRYVRILVDRATQNAVVAAAISIKTGARKLSITQHADVAAGDFESHVSPAEGTA